MRKLLFLIGITMIAILSSCTLLEEKRDGCKPPPQNFTKVDLVGTWWAGYVSSPKVDDTLIIRADGTYKQTIFLEYDTLPDVYYESDWLPWRIEYFDDGIPYLHLEGMRLCAHNPDISCDQPGGGEQDWHAFNQGEWLDYCRDEWMLQENEGILLVLGAINGDGIELAGLTATPLDAWIYRLQRSELPTTAQP
jgi:hypothetical protein